MLSILTTIGILPAERRGPVVTALQQNLANPLIGDVHVITEAPSKYSMQWLYECSGVDESCIHLQFLPNRPTFADLIRSANALLASGSGTVAIMNADVSIASAADVKHIMDAFKVLDGRKSPIVFALTLHEETGQLGLYEANGLPNTLSADAWFFQYPLHTECDVFYAPGQMNCDMMFAYDLVVSGYRLLNPCLDVQIIHHEPEKNHKFYEKKNEEDANKQMLWEKHAAAKKEINKYNYYGVPWVRSSWLPLGYVPEATTTTGKRLILALPVGAENCIETIMPILDHLALSHDFQIQILYDGDLDWFVCTYAEILSKRPQIYLTHPLEGSGATLKAFLTGNQYSFDSIAFVNNISRVDDMLLSSSQAIWVNLRPEDASPSPCFGCTLITSLFKAESFLRGFLKNVTSLVGYDHLIDHVFLVSTLTVAEITLLSSHFNSYHNVTILWFRKDPGLYDCWNTGIRIARTDYISNANVDDLRHPMHVITLLRELEGRPNVAVAATALVPFYDYPSDGVLPPVTDIWYADRAGNFEFTDLAFVKDSQTASLTPNNLPHCMPVWRRSLHSRYGWFDEASFGTFADWGFWLKVLEDGNLGWLDPAPLSFYYVNPTSHNRRGSHLEDFHRAVEVAFGPRLIARLAGQLRLPCPLPAETSRKFYVSGLEHSYGQHRSSFNNLIAALEPLNRGPGGIRFIPFLERQFVWGDCAVDGEARSDNPRPITDPWVGILHVPFDVPDWWCDTSVCPRSFFETSLFQDSLPACRGIITLSAALQKDLATYLPDTPSLSLKFPTSLNVRMWEPKSYSASPCVIQVGDWLRKLQAIHRLNAPNHRKVMLLKQFTNDFLQQEIAVFGNAIDPRVEMFDFISNEEYDKFLSQSVVICLMYSTAANNIVCECLARATPILINPLPAVVEYLGEDYPLYVRNEIEAGAVITHINRIKEAHAYLLQRRLEIDLSYQGFCNLLGTSAFYQNL